MPKKVYEGSWMKTAAISKDSHFKNYYHDFRTPDCAKFEYPQQAEEYASKVNQANAMADILRVSKSTAIHFYLHGIALGQIVPDFIEDIKDYVDSFEDLYQVLPTVVDHIFSVIDTMFAKRDEVACIKTPLISNFIGKIIMHKSAKEVNEGIFYELSCLFMDHGINIHHKHLEKELIELVSHEDIVIILSLAEPIETDRKFEDEEEKKMKLGIHRAFQKRALEMIYEDASEVVGLMGSFCDALVAFNEKAIKTFVFDNNDTKMAEMKKMALTMMESYATRHGHEEKKSNPSDGSKRKVAAKKRRAEQ